MDIEEPKPIGRIKIEDLKNRPMVDSRILEKLIENNEVYNHTGEVIQQDIVGYEINHASRAVLYGLATLFALDTIHDTGLDDAIWQAINLHPDVEWVTSRLMNVLAGTIVGGTVAVRAFSKGHVPRPQDQGALDRLGGWIYS